MFTSIWKNGLLSCRTCSMETKRNLKTEYVLDPKIFLSEELERRTRNNPRYSLRAFAKTLGLTASGLSMILNGQRRPSLKTATQISERLNLPPNVREKWIHGCLSQFTPEHLNGRGTRGIGANPSAAKNSNIGYSQIDKDSYAVISDWYHFAILSLTETRDFKPEVRWIAKRLHITPMEVKVAVERMKRIGILETKPSGWKQIGGPICVDNLSELAAGAHAQKQVLEKARESIDNDAFALRDICSMTFAMDPDLIDAAREELKKFRRYFMEKFEVRGNPSEVYHLGVQLYPVTKR